MEYNSILCCGDFFSTWLLNPTSSSLFPHFWAWGFLLGFFVVVLDRCSNYGFSHLQFQNSSLYNIMLIGSSKLYYASIPATINSMLGLDNYVKGTTEVISQLGLWKKMVKSHCLPHILILFKSISFHRRKLNCFRNVTKKQGQFISFYLLPVL